MTDMKSPNTILIAALGVALASCSFSTGTTPESAGEELIEGALGEQVELVFVDADCEAPADREVGTPFTCTAMTEAGETVTFDGVVDPDDSIFIAPSNIVAAEEMSVVETEAAGVLGEDIGAAIDPSDVDCPDQTIVLDDSVLRCEITDAASGDRYEMLLTVGGFELREGFAQRSYDVGDQLN
jgi:hypothetical protein